MLKTLARVLFGFIVACLVAGLVQVCFVMTPLKLLTSPADVFAERVGQTGLLALLAATHSAIFSAAFALIAIGIAEWGGFRGISYYLVAGTVIALLGFIAQFYSEVGDQPTILNNYALQAFISSGFFAGLAYWLAAGRSAGGTDASLNNGGEDRVAATSNSWRGRPRITVEPNSEEGAARVSAKNYSYKGLAKKMPSLSDMLARGEAKERAAKALAKSPDGKPNDTAKASPARPTSTSKSAEDATAKAPDAKKL